MWQYQHPSNKSWGSKAVVSGNLLCVHDTPLMVCSADLLYVTIRRYIGCADNNVYAIYTSGARRGQVKWTFPTGGNVQASPLLSPSGDKLYVGSHDDYVYALDTTTTAPNCSSCVANPGNQWCYTPANIAAAICVASSSFCSGGPSCSVNSCPANPQSAVVALKQQNVPLLQTMVRARSDPTSGQYAQWMTRDAVLDVIAPSNSTQDSVIAWLKGAGSQNVDNRRDSVFFTASPEGIVQLFGASVCPLLKPPSSAGATSNLKTAPKLLGTSVAAIPPNIAQYIDLWELFPPPTPSQPNAYSNFNATAGYPPSGCNTSRDPSYKGVPVATPPFYRELYAIGNMGVTNPLTNLSTQLPSPFASYAIEDMQTFAGLYNIKLGNITSQPYYKPTGDPEASLDMETATAVANGTQTVWWWAPGSWVFSMANTVFNTPNSPLVHSWSFGWEEDRQCNIAIRKDNCTFNSAVYIARTEAELMKLAAIGMTVIVASGDQGIMSALNQQCPPTAGPYLASYPQTSAWVLSAGATMMSGSTPPYTPEVVCSKATGSVITSGGGFSAYVPQPWWQAGVSDAYGRSQVLQGIVPASAFNVSYRGFPDVAALGHNFVICDSSAFKGTNYT